MNIDFKGVPVPALGLGTWKLRGRKCIRAVHLALDTGYRHIDTARRYANEADIGHAVRSSGTPRHNVFIATKIWPDDLAPRDIARRLDESLRSLQTDYVDLVLIHWPSAHIPLCATLEALQVLKDRGKTRLFGVSNFNTSLLRQARISCGMDIACNQVEYHPLLSQDRVLAFVRSHGMFLTAYAPLAKGRIMNEPLLRQIGDAHGKTPAQITLRWLVQQEAVVAIPKSDNEARIRENFDIFDFQLSDSEMTRITSLKSRNLRVADHFRSPGWDVP